MDFIFMRRPASQTYRNILLSWKNSASQAEFYFYHFKPALCPRLSSAAFAAAFHLFGRPVHSCALIGQLIICKIANQNLIIKFRHVLTAPISIMHQVYAFGCRLLIYNKFYHSQFPSIFFRKFNYKQTHTKSNYFFNPILKLCLY